MKELSPLFKRTVAMVNSIPKGKVVTYGSIAQLIGAPGCARHISYILSSSSTKYDLPWHRVVNSQGRVSLPLGNGFFRQKKLLENEGIVFLGEKINLNIYLWEPSNKEVNKLLKGIPAHSPKKLC